MDNVQVTCQMPAKQRDRFVRTLLTEEWEDQKAMR